MRLPPAFDFELGNSVKPSTAMTRMVTYFVADRLGFLLSGGVIRRDGLIETVELIDDDSDRRALQS